MTRIIAGVALAFCACAGGSGHPPTPRVTLTPAFVALGDGYTTDVSADGTASSDSIDDPAGARPLAFEWTIDDPKAHFSPDDHSPIVTVRVAGDHPAAVRLTVTDSDGEAASVSAMIGVTIP